MSPNYNNQIEMDRMEVPRVETKTTKDLLRMISGKFGPGGDMSLPDEFNSASAEGEAKAELERRIEVLFKNQTGLASCGFEFDKFMRHATAEVFTVDVTVVSHPYSDLRMVENAMGYCHSTNNVAPMGEGKFRVAFDVNKFEIQLVSRGEPAGIYVEEAPLTANQITRPQLHWANAHFDEVVQRHIGGSSTAFDHLSLREVDGHLRVRAHTFDDAGLDRLCTYVLSNRPLGFSIKMGEPLPSDGGVYLHVSFEDLKALLPSSVVDEGRADVSEAVDEGTRGI